MQKYKDALNNGGTSVAADFTMNITGTNVSNASFAGSEDGTTVGLTAGTYSVSDTGPSGYLEETVSTNCSGSINIGEQKTCTITSAQLETVENTLALCSDNLDNDQDGTIDLNDSDCQPFIPRLNVTLQIINDSGGTRGLGFGSNIAAALFGAPGSLPGTTVGDHNYGEDFNAPNSTFLLNPGSYHVLSRGNTTGYSISPSADCSGTVAAGDIKNCIITFDDIQPLLIVVKHVVNANGGIASAEDFTVDVSGNNVSTSSFRGTETGTTVSLDRGAYSVTDSGPSGYTENTSQSCSGNIELGEVKTCTLTSSDISLAVENTLALCTDDLDNDQDGTIDLNDSDCQAFIPRLNVSLQIINDNGGSRGLGFGGSISAALFGAPGSLPGTTVGDHNYGEDFNAASSTFLLNPGSFHINPRGNTAGYDISPSADCSSTTVAGDIKNCVIIFDDIQPLLTVIKHVNNNNGGTALASDFSMNISGTNVSNASFAGSEAGITVGLNVGSYSVNENGPAGYTLLSGTNCSGSVNIGESRTCIITNDDIPPALLLVKNVVNDNGGTATSTDWQLSASGPTPISGYGYVTSELSNAFMAGTYVLSESGGPANYTPSGWACTGDIANVGDSVSLDIGQNATCVITNDDNS